MLRFTNQLLQLVNPLATAGGGRLPPATRWAARRAIPTTTRDAVVRSLVMQETLPAGSVDDRQAEFRIQQACG